MKTSHPDPLTDDQLSGVSGGATTTQRLEQGGWIPSGGGSTGTKGRAPGAGPAAEFDGLRADQLTTPDMTAIPDPGRERRLDAQIDQMWNQMFPKAP